MKKLLPFRKFLILNCSFLILLAACSRQKETAPAPVPVPPISNFTLKNLLSEFPGEIRTGEYAGKVQLVLFFRTDGSGRVSHVGIYAGKGQMIHASSGSGRVRKVSLGQPYWRKRMAGGATFLGAGMPPVTRRWPADNGPNG